ncbi:MAG: type II toxin-antitoxin system VapC family toxin [Bacteroidales bacterium]|nr:type II toxin-antitoxin system VapC family toxin [Bacteroidales bacterium]
MERTVCLDTHVVVWLFYGNITLLTKKALDLINNSRTIVTPMVLFELDYLNEIDRISHSSEQILIELTQQIGLEISKNSFFDVIKAASHLDFTSDPFDRIIIADAFIDKLPLISKDALINKHYVNTVW